MQRDCSVGLREPGSLCVCVAGGGEGGQEPVLPSDLQGHCSSGLGVSSLGSWCPVSGSCSHRDCSDKFSNLLALVSRGTVGSGKKRQSPVQAQTRCRQTMG